MVNDLKPIRWVGASLGALRRFPATVRQNIGYALYLAQKGEKAGSAKPLKGIVKGAGVLEVVEEREGNAYRAVYTVRFEGAIYVLHAFQKKSKKGIKDAEADDRFDSSALRAGTTRLRGERDEMSARKRAAVQKGGGNVFADLELPEAEELLAKAELASRISRIIKGRHLTQIEAATVLDTTQPNVSNLLRGKIDGFSMERLIRFLNALDRDVEIVIKRRPRSRAVARTRVAPA